MKKSTAAGMMVSEDLTSLQLAYLFTGHAYSLTGKFSVLTMFSRAYFHSLTTLFVKKYYIVL